MSLLRRLPWYVVPLLIFTLTRVLDAILIVVVGRERIPASALPAGERVPTFVDPPSYLHLIANWDGEQYRQIVLHGYPSHLPTAHGIVLPNSWAFYPVYPGSVRLVMFSGLSYELAASLVSIAAAAAAMCLLYRMLSPACGRFAASLTVLALCVFPTAVSFQIAYSESLALLEVLACLWCLRERRYGALLGVALLLALTRPVVLPLALVVGVHWLARWWRRRREPFPPGQAIGVAAVGAMVAASAFLWALVAAVVVGRNDAYFVSENAFYLNTHTAQTWPTWLVLFATESHAGLRVVVAVMLLSIVWLVARRQARLWGSELRTWTWSYLLFVLASTRPTTSLFRLAMLAAVPWWPFPSVGATFTTTRSRVALTGVVAVGGLVAQFFWLRWVFVDTPYTQQGFFP